MMFTVPTIKRRSLRKAAISFVLIGLTVLTFASIGGGNAKNKSTLLSPGLAPARTNKGFTLKSGMNYRGSMILKEVRDLNTVSYKALTIYQKGHATYIIPNNYRLSVAHNSTKSNLQLLNLKFKLCK